MKRDLPPVSEERHGSFSQKDFEKAVGAPLETFSHNCHAASIALVKSGLLGECRVARGMCPGVLGQHSWVVLGNDCYDEEAVVIDPTLWSYDDSVEGVWVGRAYERPHQPHGSGNIFEYGKPSHGGGETITLDTEFSSSAQQFLDMLGPLDRQGWAQLAHAPVGGWPAGEIIAAMNDDERINALLPIDIVGMTTDRNPGGLYLAKEAA